MLLVPLLRSGIEMEMRRRMKTKKRRLGWIQKCKEKCVRKGWLTVKVGSGEEEMERFMVPVVYINHPLFMGLLKGAEEEYGFDQKGTITIPCRVDEFIHVWRAIEEELQEDKSLSHGQNHYYHYGFSCFRSL